MKPKSILARARAQLSMTDREIAKNLGLSIATLRTVDNPACPFYLSLALAGLIVDIKPAVIFRMPLTSGALSDPRHDHSGNPSAPRVD
ncbi:hypothetical protein [Agrobacterium sp. 22-222-1]